MTARATFKQSDIRRAVNGVTGAGLPVARVVVTDGRIEVIVGNDDSPENGDNPLEKYLDGKKA